MKIDAAGALSTIAGTGVPGFNGNGGPAAAARLNRPFDVEAGPGGRIYLSEEGNGQIRYIDPTGLIHAAQGNGAALRWTCQAAAAGARAGAPPDERRRGALSGVVADAMGNVYVAAGSMAQVKQVDTSGRVTTIAGRGEGPVYCGPPPDCSDAGDGRPALGARLVRPAALARRDDGALYVLDTGDSRVRLVNRGTRPITAHGVTVRPGTIETVAGNGTMGSAGDEGRRGRRSC